MQCLHERMVRGQEDIDHLQAKPKALLAALGAPCADVMFKQGYALARQLLTLMQEVQKFKAEEKQCEQAFRALFDIVRQLKYERRRPPGGSASGSLDSILPE